ncbi:MAG: 3-deoxy-manno-octulosonate cytidylyltransferase [Proteobacteria bacterium]|nr:3-deoxy-manno-octulosonate cytidylyltransferase [Pseudomonadota bacterium]
MISQSKATIIIPARYESSRFPGKPLAMINGLTMIERVWRIANNCKHADAVYIATDSEIIAEHVKLFGAKVIMTDESCRTGTDRVAQATEDFTDENAIVVSLQGDAVLTPPWIIDEVIHAMKQHDTVCLATPAVKLKGQALQDFLAHKKISPSSGTTVVFDKERNALYFSKQPIPFDYNANSPEAYLYRHIGLYAYRVNTLRQLQALEQSPLEKQEKLEQLRALENGIPIRIVCVDYQGRSHGSVDTPQDVKVIEKIIAAEGELVA